MAAAAVPIALKAVSAISSLLLGQHAARLKGAQTENAAIPPAVQAFDQDLAEILQAVNSGAATPSQAIAALQKVDQDIYNNLKALVGKPGTAWSDSAGMAGKCDKTCTAACCVYHGDLGPVLSVSQIALGGPGGKWGASDPRLSGRTVHVPTVYGSKYGGVNRPGYDITWNPPATPAQQAGGASGIVGTISQLISPVSTTTPSNAVVQATPAGVQSNLLMYVLLGIVGLLGLAFLVRK